MISRLVVHGASFVGDEHHGDPAAAEGWWTLPSVDSDCQSHRGVLPASLDPGVSGDRRDSAIPAGSEPQPERTRLSAGSAATAQDATQTDARRYLAKCCSVRAGLPPRACGAHCDPGRMDRRWPCRTYGRRSVSPGVCHRHCRAELLVTPGADRSFRTCRRSARCPDLQRVARTLVVGLPRSRSTHCRRARALWRAGDRVAAQRQQSAAAYSANRATFLSTVAAYSSAVTV